MPQLTTNFERVVIYGFLTPDATNFDIVQGSKLLQMVQEIRISEDFCRSDIIIIDLANYTLAHVPKINFSDVKKFEMCALVSILITMYKQMNVAEITYYKV
jgi:hypothetical protein